MNSLPTSGFRDYNDLELPLFDTELKNLSGQSSGEFTALSVSQWGSATVGFQLRSKQCCRSRSGNIVPLDTWTCANANTKLQASVFSTQILKQQ